MFSARWLLLGAVALSLIPSFASADESVVDTVKKRVDEGLLKPLADKERETSRFSRARLPPRERRVRVTQATTTPDEQGRAFVPFAIDVRFGDEWHENDLVGCAYPSNGQLFVKIGESYRPASFLLGKKADPVAGVCTARARA